MRVALSLRAPGCAPQRLHLLVPAAPLAHLRLRALSWLALPAAAAGGAALSAGAGGGASAGASTAAASALPPGALLLSEYAEERCGDACGDACGGACGAATLRERPGSGGLSRARRMGAGAPAGIPAGIPAAPPSRAHAARGAGEGLGLLLRLRPAGGGLGACGDAGAGGARGLLGVQLECAWEEEGGAGGDAGMGGGPRLTPPLVPFLLPPAPGGELGELAVLVPVPARPPPGAAAGRLLLRAARLLVIRCGVLQQTRLALLPPAGAPGGQPPWQLAFTPPHARLAPASSPRPRPAAPPPAAAAGLGHRRISAFAATPARAEAGAQAGSTQGLVIYGSSWAQVERE